MAGAEPEQQDALNRVHKPSLDGLLRDLGLGLGDVHLRIDMWEVASARDVSRALQVAEASVQWAGSRGQWASVTVAAGAFLKALSDLAVNTSTDIPRYDATLWQRLCQRPGLPMVPDFGTTQSIIRRCRRTPREGHYPISGTHSPTTGASFVNGNSCLAINHS